MVPPRPLPRVLDLSGREPEQRSEPLVLLPHTVELRVELGDDGEQLLRVVTNRRRRGCVAGVLELASEQPAGLITLGDGLLSPLPSPGRLLSGSRNVRGGPLGASAPALRVGDAGVGGLPGFG